MILDEHCCRSLQVAVDEWPHILRVLESHSEQPYNLRKRPLQTYQELVPRKKNRDALSRLYHRKLIFVWSNLST